MKKVCCLLLAALLLSGCGAAAQPETTVTTAPAETTQQTTAAPETTVPETTEPLVPVYPDQIPEGTYEITVDSSSSMFRVVKCILAVKDGRMTATMTMGGKGYGKLFMGTGEEALAATEDQYIPFVMNADDAKDFTVPVEALNLPTDCAAWSIKKEKWYDRVLVFRADGVPVNAGE